MEGKIIFLKGAGYRKEKSGNNKKVKLRGGGGLGDRGKWKKNIRRQTCSVRKRLNSLYVSALLDTLFWNNPQPLIFSQRRPLDATPQIGKIYGSAKLP